MPGELGVGEESLPQARELAGGRGLAESGEGESLGGWRHELTEQGGRLRVH